MQHVSYVHAENMVIALITVILISNFYSLPRGVPAPAFVEISFHPSFSEHVLHEQWLLRTRPLFPAEEHEVFASVCLQDKSCCVLVLSKLPVILCIFIAAAQLNFQKSAGSVFLASSVLRQAH